MNDDADEFIQLLDEISELSNPASADPDTIDRLLQELADVEIDDDGVEISDEPLTVEVGDDLSDPIESSPMIPVNQRDSDAWNVPTPKKGIQAPETPKVPTTENPNAGMKIFRRERTGKRPKTASSGVFGSVGTFSKTSEKVEQYKAFRESDMSEVEAAMDAISWVTDDDD